MGSVMSVISCQRRVGAKKFQRRVGAKSGLQRSGSKEVAAKKWQQRSGSKEVAAKNITDITDPTPAPPRKGRVQEGMAAHE